MLTNVTRIRALFVLMVLAFLTSPATVNAGLSGTNRGTTGSTKQEVVVEHTQAGSPELGVLLIIGIVAAVIFMAWVFSRMGDDHSATGSDVPA